MKQTFKQFLLEVFDYHAPFKWIYIDSDEARCEFTINNKEYAVLFGLDEERDYCWDVVFDLKERGARAPYKPTGYGQQFTILSTVKFILLDFITKNPEIRIINFTADMPSRIRAYDRLAQSIIDKLGNDWSLKIVDRGIRKYYLIKN